MDLRQDYTATRARQCVRGPNLASYNMHVANIEQTFITYIRYVSLNVYDVYSPIGVPQKSHRTGLAILGTPID